LWLFLVGCGSLLVLLVLIGALSIVATLVDADMEAVPRESGPVPSPIQRALTNSEGECVDWLAYGVVHPVSWSPRVFFYLDLISPEEAGYLKSLATDLCTALSPQL
jgi:hypothetical protein